MTSSFAAPLPLLEVGSFFWVQVAGCELQGASCRVQVAGGRIRQTRCLAAGPTFRRSSHYLFREMIDPSARRATWHYPERFIPMKWIKRIGIFFGGLYLLLCLLLYVFQDSLIFHPRALAAEHSYGNYEESWIELEDGDRLHALRLRDEPAEGVILYLHGNVGNNGRSLYQTKSIRGLGYDLFLVDYRGFGKSEGVIDDENDMTSDLQAVYDALKQEYAESNIFIAGYSLGSGPASYLAANNSPGGVLLVSPYTSLVDMKNRFFWMFPDFLLKYSLDNAANLAASNCPVIIVHGTDDELIPLDMGKGLSRIDPTRISLLELDGVGHRGAILNTAIKEAMNKLLKR